jgi:enoyl-CoA hydratase
MAAVLVERRGAVLLITLNRPEARNALAPEVAVRLSRAWEELATSDELRVAIVTGAGDRAFCAGADLARTIPLLGGQRKPEDEFDRELLANPECASRAVLLGFDPGKPIIAAVNGVAVGGGFELLLATDLRVAVPEARFGLPEVKRALFPGGGGPVRLARQIPWARALELCLTGETISAEEAQALGLVNRVVPREKLLDAAFELASRIAANGPIAVRATRAALRQSSGVPEDEALRRAALLGAPVYRSEDAIEGARAFLEKREPVYRGR